MKKLIHGIGINDVDYQVQPRNGKPKCIAYTKWRNMIRRCYDEPHHLKYPTYEGCTVAPEWHRLSNFKAWHDQQNYTEGLQLDKDIIYPGNKVYGPETCVYVTRELNNFLTKRSDKKYLTGVEKMYSTEGTKMFRSVIRRNGKKNYLGYHYTPEEAHAVYAQAKINYIQNYYLINETDQRIIDGLTRWIDVLRNGMYDLV